MKIQQIYSLYGINYSISIDSRNIKPGDVFFGIKGDRTNGNLYAQDAIKKGAIAAVVDDEQISKHDKCIFVSDSLEALQTLATYHRSKLNIPILGITGTNGKTTTKELVASVLDKKFNIHYTQGNFNNHIGVPLTLLGMRPETEFGIVEMGANHQGEIEILCNFAKPNFGIITNIGKAHLEGFGSYEGVIKTKKELYDYIRCTGGKIFVNTDNSLLAELSRNISRITYGQKSRAEITGSIMQSPDYLNIRCKFIDSENSLPLELQTRLVGNYNFENVMAAVAVGRYFGVDNEKIKVAIETYAPENNRSQIVRKGNKIIIVDCYNANPTSMKAAIDNLFMMNDTKGIPVLGDMFELGSDSIHEHESILELLKERGFSNVFLAGKLFFELKDKYQNFCFYQTTEDLANTLKNTPLKSTPILIKGSRGMKMESLTDIIV
jgi:UDP-N-acetylmuramoyl-tripeptide--D-alanyl-D-alanine ligase